MADTLPLAYFDRDKPFYPLVMQYVVQLAGYKELALQAAADGVMYGIRKDADGSIDEAQVLAWELSALRGDLRLASAVTDEPLTVNPDAVGAALLAEGGGFAAFAATAAGSLLIVAHDVCRNRPAHDDGPLWEFLRHCRNAAANDGRFTFKRKEPKKAIKWRALTIDRLLEGIPLFAQRDEAGLLHLADPILLLWDIEQAYPKLR